MGFGLPCHGGRRRSIGRARRDRILDIGDMSSVSMSDPYRITLSITADDNLPPGDYLLAVQNKLEPKISTPTLIIRIAP